MPSYEHDCNLLLGILALQMDFIRRDQLIAATSTWLLDKSRSLESILVEQGALSEQDRQLLVPLMARHLEHHDGDPSASLSALEVVHTLAQEVKALGDEEVVATLTMASTARSLPKHSDHPAAAFDVSKSQEEQRRFQILRSHARGGLGEVYVARDCELNREVALKEIQSRFANDQDSRARFLVEAEVTGGLEHPGIVPVYAMGTYDDGRPYYAMRFIKGNSLKTAVKQFHAGGTPDFQGLPFRKLLGRFVDVCHAIQYAHSRGVLHRDLKPGNIMLGKHGETLVVDWGLAKVKGRSEVSPGSDEHTLRPEADSNSAPTQLGTAIGTPAFMPPEQAAGKLEELGPASDVYSLGATLYFLLCGQAPFAGDNLTTLLEAVKTGRLQAPRELLAGVPCSLDAICRRAMALKPADRYTTPEALAEEIERYLADEPVDAYSGTWVERAQRWVRRHTAMVTGISAAGLMFLLALGVMTLLTRNHNEQLVLLNQQLNLTNSELEAANQSERAARVAAETAELTARRQNIQTLDSLNTLINDIQTRLADYPGGSRLRKSILASSLARLDVFDTAYIDQVAVDHSTLLALLNLGDAVRDLGVGEVPAAAPSAADSSDSPAGQRSSLAVAKQLYERALQIAQSIPPEKQSFVEETETTRIQYKITAFANQAVLYERLGNLARQEGKLSESQASFRQALQICEQMLSQNPSDTWAQRTKANMLVGLGDVERLQGRIEDALGYYQQSLEIRQAVHQANSDDVQMTRELAQSHEKLGVTYQRMGQLDQAANEYQAVLALDRAKFDEANLQSRSDLAAVLEKLGTLQLLRNQVEDAHESFTQCKELRETLVRDDPESRKFASTLATAMMNLADAQLRLGNSDPAIELLEEARKRLTKLAEEDPDDATIARDLCGALRRLGRLRMQYGPLELAITHFQEAITRTEALAQLDARDFRAQQDLSLALDDLGDAYLKTGDIPAAKQQFERSVEISEAMDVDSLDAQTRRNYSVLLNNLGNLVVLYMEKPAEGLTYYRRALAIRQQLLDPADPSTQRDVYGSHVYIGDALLRMGQANDALAEFEKALRIFQQMAGTSINDRQTIRDAWLLNSKVGDALLSMKRFEDAKTFLLEGLRFSQHLAKSVASDRMSQRDLSISFEKLAEVSAGLGNNDEALEYFSRRLAISKGLADADPKDAESLDDVVIVNRKLGEFCTGIDEFDKADEYYQAAMDVLQTMVTRQMTVLGSQDRMEYIESLRDRSRTIQRALGTAEPLLELPTEEQLLLLELRAIELVKRQRFEEATATAAWIQANEAAPAKLLYNVACVYSLAAASLSTKGVVPGADDAQEANQQCRAWTQASLEALRQAVEAGWDDFELMAKDPKLAAVQDEPAFKKLVARQP